MDRDPKTAWDAWLSDPAIDEPHKHEIRQLLTQGDEKDLADRFYRQLEFGTGGMRGLMGAGINRMNVYTVGAAAQGLANYIATFGEQAKAAGVAIAYDCRRNSRLFAQTTAAVLAANGVTSYLFKELRPTPQLSFAVRHLKCTAGVVITASHNPPAYNGFKAYWSDGGGVVPPHDENIIRQVRAIRSFSDIKRTPVEQAVSNGAIKLIGDELDAAFLQAVQNSCLELDIVRAQGRSLKIVYTALHGTGGTLVPQALTDRGFANVIQVPQQAEPNGEFPTVASPNPEEGPALDMAIALAKREGADLVIGTDPDADRVGIAVRGPGGAFVLLSGNQTAALLTWYICDHHQRAGTFPPNSALITTIVSGDMMKDIARNFGAEVIETLTGFKWIGEKVTQFEETGGIAGPSKMYLFGAEESYGYMPCTFTRDKDAVTSACFIADLAAVAASRGKNLYALLDDLYRQFGYYQEHTLNVTLPGREGADKIKAMMAGLRSDPPREMAGIPVVRMGDCLSGEIRDLSTGQLAGRYDLPAADVILLTLSDGSKVIARPSGTEPKIKFYLLTREPADDLDRAKAAAVEKINALTADLRRRVL